MAETQVLGILRATSSAFRPACTCFAAPTIHAYIGALLLIRFLPFGRLSDDECADFRGRSFRIASELDNSRGYRKFAAGLHEP